MLFLLVISLGSLSFGCERVTEPIKKLTATKIKDILDHPRDYETKDVTVYGTVTGGVSLVFIKYFEIQDDTGSIKVVTDRILPAKGEKLRVTGRMTAIEIGPERWIVLREKSDAVGQGAK